MVESGAADRDVAADRAAALEAKMGKRRPKPKDLAAIKDAHWKRYNELDRPVDPAAPPAAMAAAAPQAVVDDRRRVAPTAVSASESSAASSSYVLSGVKHTESASNAAIRAQRAAVFSQPAKAKAAKAAQGRDERWKAYAQFEQASGSQENVVMNAPLPFGFPAASPPSASYSSPESMYATPPPPVAAASAMPSSSSSSSYPSASAPPAIAADSYFQQQMLYLLGKVRVMPPASVALIRKILQNCQTHLRRQTASAKRERKDAAPGLFVCPCSLTACPSSPLVSSLQC